MSLGKNTAEELQRQNVFSYSYLNILFAVAKNAEIWGLFYPAFSYVYMKLVSLDKQKMS